MSRPVILRPLAEADIVEIFGDLEYVRAGLGKRFLAQLRATFEQIETMSELFGVIWQDVRAVRLKRFRYVVYYVVLPDRVEVLAVLHGSRDTSAWQDRVE
jgi:plasmid stabilization system protein ParE